LYGPNNATCTGTSIYTATVTVAGNGTYASGNFTMTSAGTYRSVANYSGDANNVPTADICHAAKESVIVAVPRTITPVRTLRCSNASADDVFGNIGAGGATS
jgi:hypothetical protein